MKYRELYNSAPGARNGSFDGVLAEALACQMTGGLRPWPQAGDHGFGPFALRRQPGDRLVGGLVADPVPAEVVPDVLVAVATIRKGPRPGPCEPLVVDVADALQRLERGRPPVLVDPCLGEPLLHLAA